MKLNTLASAATMLCLLCLGGTAAAQETAATKDKPRASANQSGVDRMKAIMDSMQSGQQGGLSGATQRAVQTGVASGEKSAKLDMPASTVEFSIKANEQWQQMSREAFVAALPPRDRAIGASVILGDGTLPGNQGKLYFFVSRSMPVSLLRAYALEALYTGASLVTRGIRKGDTIKEYIEEAMTDFNNAEGTMLAGMEVNPNLFDMFNVTVVPAVVWTNRIGLEDIGAGCQDLPEGSAMPQVEMTGPDDQPIMVDKPTCAPASPSSYYKIAGALTLPYVLDRFEEAGLSREATKVYRTALADRNGNVHQGQGAVKSSGNTMSPLVDDIKIDRMPRHVLLDWQTQLSTQKVQRGPYGPVFGNDAEEDATYRQELDQKVRHGLGL
jgi:type-F conjugative transfer system pilin assembly protein TrbC